MRSKKRTPNLDERRRILEELADRRYAKLMASGESASWVKMRSYLESWAAGVEAKLLASKKPPR